MRNPGDAADEAAGSVALQTLGAARVAADPARGGLGSAGLTTGTPGQRRASWREAVWLLADPRGGRLRGRSRANAERLELEDRRAAVGHLVPGQDDARQQQGQELHQTVAHSRSRASNAHATMRLAGRFVKERFRRGSGLD